jgi:hypothetical protein
MEEAVPSKSSQAAAADASALRILLGMGPSLERS